MLRRDSLSTVPFLMSVPCVVDVKQNPRRLP
nr:MAG TPA: hypothetical protein [Caudoviricetes sp.]